MHEFLERIKVAPKVTRAAETEDSVVICYAAHHIPTIGIYEKAENMPMTA
jgi:hypothetical protein